MGYDLGMSKYLCLYKATISGEPCGNPVSRKAQRCAAGHPFQALRSMALMRDQVPSAVDPASSGTIDIEDEIAVNAYESEVDTEIANTSMDVWEKITILERCEESLHYHAGHKRAYYKNAKYKESVEEALAICNVNSERTYESQDGTIKVFRTQSGDAMDAYHKAKADLDVAQKQLEDVEARYGGWSRFFIVNNNGGHIHSSRGCSTCYSTTRFGWLPHLSGLDEKSAVEDQGPKLCSICFPSAPVEWTNFWQLDAIEKEKAKCHGSGTDHYERKQRSRYQKCNECGEYVTTTTVGVMRAHKPKKKK